LEGAVSLTVETIERIAAQEKENWQRKVNQGVLKGDLNQSLSALGAMDGIEKLTYVLTLEISREFDNRLRAEMHQRRPAKLRALRAVSK
jgi:hypothetical protein